MKNKYFQKKSKNSHEISEINFWNRHLWFRKTKKPSGPTERALNFPKNQKLLKSVYGARRTVLPNAITLRGGPYRTSDWPIGNPPQTSDGNSCVTQRKTLLQICYGFVTDLKCSRQSLLIRKKCEKWEVFENPNH